MRFQNILVGFWVSLWLSSAVPGFGEMPTNATASGNPCSLDLSTVRGFNYTPANRADHEDCWVNYDEAVTEHDLNLAKRLNLNQARVFVRYDTYLKLGEAMTGKVRHFIRACHERGMGVMLVLDKKSPWDKDATLRPLAKKWAEYLTASFSGEPGLVMWDIMNEPDFSMVGKEQISTNYDNCKYLAGLFHELDHQTPITIGMASVAGMEKLADYVDVLQFHDYSPTREEIRHNIARAKSFAAKVGKPLFDGEIGCVGRANPYDVALEEHAQAGVGWYIWELMIVRQGWGAVHGVFYEDGRVRDPSIAAAILGFYRNRGTNILLTVPDYEGWVTKIVERGQQWLQDPKASWSDGLDIAETCANLLESAELVPMRTPPTWEVASLRSGNPELPVLRALIKKYVATLEPCRLPPKVKKKAGA